MTDSSIPSPQLWIRGSGLGILTWGIGYALTYLLVANDLRESFLQQVIETFQDEPATYEMVGWVFYNAHFVDTSIDGVPLIGGSSTNFIGGDDGFSTILYLIPVALLLGSGLALARYEAADSPTTGVVTGMSLVPGYLLAILVGVFLFEVSVGSISASPDVVQSLGLAGVTYPLIFGGIGGAIAGLTSPEATA